ncbi:MAG TPA: efflux RND transporter periplasmic adaptor subunit [Pirellulales bacterium]|nr:efflux RND transporter periplasmic adaptor subunit [Pirellulales bacterium]
MQPQQRRMTHIVGQPSFVQSYERTSIYPKTTGFIEKWNVDIGDQVQKGDVLADLFVPELRELWQTKKNEVIYDRQRVEYARELVEVAKAEVEAAEANVKQSKEMLEAYKAEVNRWDSEVIRLKNEVKRKVVAPQILLESQEQHKSDIAKWQAQDATVSNMSANLKAKLAALKAAIVDVEVAQARVAVAESEAQRLEAWVGYLKLFAPYDGIVVARNANTWDFVLPQTGDPTAEIRAPFLSPGEKAAPIYVIDRTDIVRIYVDVPERDANYISIGTPAQVKIWAYKDEWLPAYVTRYSWALQTRSRTMRVEIDLKNYERKILPGMYAYGKISVEHPDIHAIPKSAIEHSGGKSFVWLYKEGKAHRTQVELGMPEEKWVEVIKFGTDEKYHGHPEWTAVTGEEQVLIGHRLSTLTDGAEVEIDDSPAPIEEEGLQERNNEM